MAAADTYWFRMRRVGMRYSFYPINWKGWVFVLVVANGGFLIGLPLFLEIGLPLFLEKPVPSDPDAFWPTWLAMAAWLGAGFFVIFKKSMPLKDN